MKKEFNFNKNPEFKNSTLIKIQNSTENCVENISLTKIKVFNENFYFMNDKFLSDSWQSLK